MAYTKHTWDCDELITADKLNHIENGIEEAEQNGCGLVPGTYRYDGSSTTEITFTDANLIGKSFIITGTQDAGNPPLRAQIDSTTGTVTVFLSDPITVMRVNYIAW